MLAVRVQYSVSQAVKYTSAELVVVERIEAEYSVSGAVQHTSIELVEVLKHTLSVVMQRTEAEYSALEEMQHRSAELVVVRQRTETEAEYSVPEVVERKLAELTEGRTEPERKHSVVAVVEQTELETKHSVADSKAKVEHTVEAEHFVALVEGNAAEAGLDRATEMAHYLLLLQPYRNKRHSSEEVGQLKIVGHTVPLIAK